jgi:two-component sensor histidine kinase
LSAAARRARNPEARAGLEEAMFRVSAMAAAQRPLYSRKRGNSFSAAEFLQAVCETSRQTFPAAVDIQYHGVDMQLSNDVAMPLSLILHELLTNAVKHAARDKGGATVKVRLTGDRDKFVLCVEDGGPGFDFDQVRGRASGLLLVEGLARQIGGRFRVARTPVSSCCVEFSHGALA